MPMKMRLLKKENAKVMPWKNGRGSTTELAIHPEGEDFRKGDFLWRISSASVNDAGAFSFFPFHNRWLTVLNGKGLRLHQRDELTPMAQQIVEVRPLTLYNFDGAAEIHCELLGGPVIDFNVFARKSRVTASAKVIELKAEEEFSWKPSARWNFLFVANGNSVVQWPTEDSSGDPIQIREGDSLLIENEFEHNEKEILEINPGVENSARLLLIELQLFSS
jgi:uncharacterized protein